MRRLCAVAHSFTDSVHLFLGQLDQAERFRYFARHAVHRAIPKCHAGPTHSREIRGLRNAIANRRPSEEIPATAYVGHPKAVPAIGPDGTDLTRNHQLASSLKLATNAIVRQVRRQVCVRVVHRSSTEEPTSLEPLHVFFCFMPDYVDGSLSARQP